MFLLKNWVLNEAIEIIIEMLADKSGMGKLQLVHHDAYIHFIITCDIAQFSSAEVL